jgi:hypothetical protein
MVVTKEFLSSFGNLLIPEMTMMRYFAMMRYFELYLTILNNNTIATDCLD